MKKFLVMLLALCMVLSMSFAFAACDPAEEDSSADTTDETSEAASKEESKEESIESVDTTSEESADTSVDASSEDESSEVPSEEPSAIAYEYKTSPAGTNYATKSTYTTSRGGDIDPANIYLGYSDGTTDWADADNKKLIDGVVGDASTYDSGRGAQAGVTVSYVGTDASFEFIFDLGDHYSDINSLVFRQARHGTPNGNNRGFEVKLVQVSDDGINWTRAKGSLTSVQIAGAVEISSKIDPTVNNIEHFDFTYALETAAKGKFVKVVLSNDGGYVLQFEELEIRN